MRLGSVAIALALATSASAVDVDLTTGPTASGSAGQTIGPVGGQAAIFKSATDIIAGTGNINSFVRIQKVDTEQGYNTSSRPVAFDEKTDPNFTRDIKLSEVPYTTINGINYFVFLLDINEPNNSDSFISLDDVELYTSAAPITAVAGKTPGDAIYSGITTKVYDLNLPKDSAILLDHMIQEGSGRTDMAMYVPFWDTFDNIAAQSGDNLYLYSAFGQRGIINYANGKKKNFKADDYGSAAGFEEWAVPDGTNFSYLPPPPTPGGNPSDIPEPATGLLALMGLAGLGRRRRREA